MDTLVMNGFTRIGSFGVDSGTVMIVDPCYVLDGAGKYPLSFGHDWGESIARNCLAQWAWSAVLATVMASIQFTLARIRMIAS